ncbi:MAG: DUF1214 domain-containing protein [Maricaulaceae bacterium]
MKKLLLLPLALLALFAAYIFGTFQARDVVSAPPAEWTGGSEAAQAWREIAVSFEAAGAKVYAATTDAREREDGLRYLTQLLSAAIEMKVSKGDRARPAFTDWMGDDRKILGDSPDAVYHTAEISGDHIYEVTGTREMAEYFGMMIYGRAVNGWNKVGANINSETMTFDAQGRFRVQIGGTEPSDGGDWLPLTSDSHMVMVRQYFHNRADKTEARFTIRNVNTLPPAPPSDTVLAARLREATAFFNGSLDGTLALSEMLIETPNSNSPPKRYNADFGGIFYPTDDNQYLGTWFAVEAGEALMIEGTAPNVDYWSVSLQNRWLQSLDYENYQVSLDNRKITLDENGRYRIVVSAQKPDSGDWLDTAGYNSGLIAIRYQLAGDVPPPTMTLVKVGELE